MLGVGVGRGGVIMRGCTGAGVTTGVGDDTPPEPPPPDGAGTAGVADTVEETVPVPIVFFAETLKEYEVPLVRPVTV
jgi:hypothetical protein